VDKLTARGFMLASRDYGHRNLSGHLVQTDVKSAASVFSGFIPALTGVWTDHNTEQLNLLNDEGFSSYRTERTIVPKSGTTEFVISVRTTSLRRAGGLKNVPGRY
jgi:hypothetical protein